MSNLYRVYCDDCYEVRFLGNFLDWTCSPKSKKEGDIKSWIAMSEDLHEFIEKHNGCRISFGHSNQLECETRDEMVWTPGVAPYRHDPGKNWLAFQYPDEQKGGDDPHGKEADQASR